MKNARKLTSILVLIAMLFMIAAPAMAASNDGKITITNPVEGETYDVYLMFELESFKDTAYSYKITDDWKEFVETGYGKDIFTVDDQGYVTLKENVTINSDSSEAAALAKKAIAYAKDKELKPVATLNKTASSKDNLTLGYYVVDSSLGTLCSLTTTAKEVDITEKNETPDITKEVQEDSKIGTANEWGETNDADINQTVNFKTTVTVTKGAQGYEVHDVMSAGLTLNDDVTVQGATEDDYTVVYDPTGCNHSDLNKDDKTCDFKVTFTQAYLDRLTANLSNDNPTTEIVITYSAILNKDAVIAGDGNPNDTQLKYGKDSYTQWKETITYTYKFDLVKTDDTNKVLDGAEFNLYDAEKGGNLIPLVEEDGYYRVANETERTAEGFTSATITAGQALIKGLDGHTTYWLEETNAPEGYNKLTARKEVKIEAANLDATVDAIDGVSTWTNGGVQVVNKAGTLLPSTGGIGTTIFYVVGAALVVGAGVLLVTKKRMTGQR